MDTIEAVPKSEMFPSKRRLGWAGLAAVLGSAALCGLPVLAAVVFGGGAATVMSKFARPGVEIVAGGLIFAGTLGFMAMRVRAKMQREGQSCGSSCSISPASLFSGSDAGSGSGSGPPHVARIFSRQGVAGAPIVCTGDLTHAQIQIDGYRAAFARLARAEQFPGGFRWTFRRELGLESQLRGLAEREAECCQFATYTLTSDGEHIVWETKADDRAAASVMDEYFHLPERLQQETRPGHDVETVKRAAGEAGLRFTADGAAQS